MPSPSPAPPACPAVQVAADLGVITAPDGARLPQYPRMVKKILGGQQVISALNLATRTFKPNVGIIAGDISYADGLLYKWEEFAAQAGPFLSSMPILTCEGNHEASGARAGGKGGEVMPRLTHARGHSFHLFETAPNAHPNSAACLLLQLERHHC